MEKYIHEKNISQYTMKYSMTKSNGHIFIYVLLPTHQLSYVPQLWKLDSIEAWGIEDTCYDSKVFFLETRFEILKRSQKNAHFHFKYHCLYLVWWQTQLKKRKIENSTSKIWRL